MKTSRKNKHQLLNLLLNIVIPSLIMVKLSSPDRLGPFLALLIALFFPLSYGLYNVIHLRQYNFFSLIGFASILLTGTIGLFQLNSHWIALKETSIPLLIGLSIVLSQRTKYPLVRTFLQEIIDIHKIDKAFQQINHTGEFERQLTRASYLLGFSYVIAAILNFILAIILVKSPPGTTQYTQELGRMTALSFPIIGLPMALMSAAIVFFLIYSIKTHTKLSIDEIFHS